MKKKTEKRLKIIGITAIIVVAILAVLRFAGFLSIVPACDETAYITFRWEGNKLIYSDISSISRCGDYLTNNHNYVQYYSTSPSFGWTPTNPQEPDPSFIYAPTELVEKFGTPQALAKSMSCEVSGVVTSMFADYGGGSDDVTIPFSQAYYYESGKVEWISKDRGFRCILNDSSYDLPAGQGKMSTNLKPIYDTWCPIKDSQYSNYLAGCYRFSPKISGVVQFTVDIPEKECGWCGDTCVDLSINKYCLSSAPPEGMECIELDGQCIMRSIAECSADITELCPDESVIITKQCISGKYQETENTCPTDEGGFPASFYYSLGGIGAGAIGLGWLLMKKKKR